MLHPISAAKQPCFAQRDSCGLEARRCGRMARYGKFAFVRFFCFLYRSFRLLGLGLLSLSLLVNPVVETRTVSTIPSQLPVPQK